MEKVSIKKEVEEDLSVKGKHLLFLKIFLKCKFIFSVASLFYSIFFSFQYSQYSVFVNNIGAI